MTLSTHVLDTARGRPATGVPVRLEKDGALIAAGHTDADGRLRFDESLAADLEGPCRLVFDTAAYLGPGAFFPEVTIVFQPAGEAHLHVPLLLSPFGYSTYRGS